MNPTEQKIRECATKLVRDGCIYDDVGISEVIEILEDYFGEPKQVSNCCKAPMLIAGGKEGTRWHECTKCGGACDGWAMQKQPDKSLDEIVEKYAEGSTLELHTRTSHAIRNACLEYAAIKGDEAAEIYRKAWLEALDAQNTDPYHYFKVHEVGRPLPIDTEILLDDGRWVEACSWPQYDATINYQARVKKGAKK